MTKCPTQGKEILALICRASASGCTGFDLEYGPQRELGGTGLAAAIVMMRQHMVQRSGASRRDEKKWGSGSRLNVVSEVLKSLNRCDSETSSPPMLLHTNLHMGLQTGWKLQRLTENLKGSSMHGDRGFDAIAMAGWLLRHE